MNPVTIAQQLFCCKLATTSGMPPKYKKKALDTPLALFDPKHSNAMNKQMLIH